MKKRIKSPLAGASKARINDYRQFAIRRVQWERNIAKGIIQEFNTSDLKPATLTWVKSFHLYVDVKSHALDAMEHRENAAFLLETAHLSYLSSRDPKQYQLIMLRKEIGDLNSTLQNKLDLDQAEVMQSLQYLVSKM